MPRLIQTTSTVILHSSRPPRDLEVRQSNASGASRLVLLVMVVCLAIVGTAASQPPTVTVTALHTGGLRATTFESHNQKVVSNAYGIFVSYVVSGDANAGQVHWRLVRSVDGGATFSTLAEGTHGTYPPVLETDRDGNIYMIRSDASPSSNDAILYRFMAANNFTSPSTTRLSDGAALKFAAVIDEARGQLYYAATNGVATAPRLDFPQTVWFYVVGLDGVVRSKVRLTLPGLAPTPAIQADAHYPVLHLDQHGDLYAAWSTIQAGFMHYESIHFMRSRDGGVTWQTLDGTPLTLPVISDHSGPTEMVNLPGERNASPWLWNMVAKQGKLHFPYRVSSMTGRPQHYVRYDVVTGQRELDIAPVWSGGSIALNHLDGFCPTQPARADSTLYCVSAVYDSVTDSGNQLAVLSSTDNGNTWQDYASTGSLTPQKLYGIGGAREITADGHIIGTYTDYNGATVTDPETGLPIKLSSVYFFKVPVPMASGARLPATVRTSAEAAGYPTANAGDGNPTTQWVATLTPDFANNNAWIQLDLGSVKDVRRVRWYGGQQVPYPAHSPTDYLLDASSDGVNWSRVSSRTHSEGHPIGDEPVRLNARFLRLTTTKVHDGTGWSLSFFEFWAEGAALPVTARLPATVSTNAAASGYPASYANDSNPATQWVASLTPHLSNNSAWIKLDLGSVKPIARLKWNGAAWDPYPAHSPTSYVIQVSTDNVNWVTIRTRTSPSGVISGDELVDVSARYVQLTTTKVNDGSGWSLSFFEFWAEGP